MKIGPTDSARADLDQDLPWVGLRHWHFGRIEILPRSAKNHCAHNESEPQYQIGSSRAGYRMIMISCCNGWELSIVSLKPEPKERIRYEISSHTCLRSHRPRGRFDGLSHGCPGQIGGQARQSHSTKRERFTRF